MPADRLNGALSEVPAVDPFGDAETAHRAVLAVLGGTPLSEVADRFGTTSAHLEAAVTTFRRAGLQALEEQAGWWQLYVEFTDWETAEQLMADHLASLLARFEADRDLVWWFVRKYPCWRLRLRTRDLAVRNAVGDTLDDLVTVGHLRRWWTGIYEPEVPAFGGSVGMEAAHRLFHTDSRIACDLPRQEHSALGRRELSILLCAVLMRAAGLEWYEQGDVWERVCQERGLPQDVSPERLHAMVQGLRTLLLADTAPTGPLLGPGGAAEFAAPWAEGFRAVGRTLGTASRAGKLDRGLRRVLAYHVIFHWNRWGISGRAQAALAWAARAAILDPPTPGIHPT